MGDKKVRKIPDYTITYLVRKLTDFGKALREHQNLEPAQGIKATIQGEAAYRGLHFPRGNFLRSVLKRLTLVYPNKP